MTDHVDPALYETAMLALSEPLRDLLATMPAESGTNFAILNAIAHLTAQLIGSAPPSQHDAITAWFVHAIDAEVASLRELHRGGGLAS